MIDKVLNTIRNNKMFNVGDKVVVAVSGGPDSICLLHVLYIIKDKLGIDLVAAHINHCLRGDEANKDEEYVKEFCNSLDIECFVKRENVEKVAMEKKISTEMAGREIRYDFFQKILTKIQGNKVAIAHNSNDQAETVLMRIIRGTGIEGLVGIKVVRDNIFVRPIIDISRVEIEEYCKDNNLNPRIDKSNLETIYTRNKVRLELIPYIEKNFNPHIIETLNRLSLNMKDDSDYIAKISIEHYKTHCKKTENRIIINKIAFEEHISILSRMIRMALKDIKGDLYNLDKKHIEDVINIQKGHTGKSIMLPEGIRVLNNYGDICFYSEKHKSFKDIYEKEYILKIDSENKLNEIGLSINLKVIDAQNIGELNKKKLIKCFDYDKIADKIKLRYRKNGDKFVPFGMKGSKKLKDLFIDLKIPKDERDEIPLIIFGEDIAWIVGYRISEKFKIDKNTKNILQIIIEREE